MRSRIGRTAILVVLLGLLGCSNLPPDRMSSFPTDSPPPVGPSLSEGEHEELLAKARASLECSYAWAQQNNLKTDGLYRYFVEAELVKEFHQVSTRLAPHEHVLVDLIQTGSATESFDFDFTALTLAQDSEFNSPEREVELNSWMAWFLDRASQGKCSPDPKLLQRINKQP